MIVGNTRFLQSLDVGRQQKLAQDIAVGQVQVSGRKRLLASSDDPIASARIAQIGRQQGIEAAWSSNLDTAAANAARADEALETAATMIDRAKELMLSAASGTLSDDDRAVVAVELRSISAELTRLSTMTDFRGNPLFSDGDPPQIPVGVGLSVAPVDSKENVFGSIVTPSGTFDLATIASNAADTIELSDPVARRAAAKTALDSLDAAATHVLTVRGEQGLRAGRIDDLKERLESASVSLEEERSGLEDTDLAEVIARIQSKQITLQASQALYAKLNQQTLFDLLR